MTQTLKSETIDAAHNEAAVIVPVVLDAGRTVRANLTFDVGLLEAIDAEAARRGLTGSAFMASAARQRLESVGERFRRQHLTTRHLTFEVNTSPMLIAT